MACYEGETLRDRIERNPLGLDDALNIGQQISEGLARAHAKGIVHRDLKPANIMITEDGVAKIMDFGLAKLADRTRITRPGTSLGTPAYMSPEQALGMEVDQRSDIFSLGVMLYEMLAGRRPFKGKHEAAVLHSILYEEPEPLTDSRPSLPERVQDIIERTLEKDVDKRYPSSSELALDLASLREETRAGLAGKSRKASVGRRFLIPAIVVLVAALAYVALSQLGPGENIGSPLKALLSMGSGRTTGMAGEDIFTIVLAPFWAITNEAQEEGAVMRGLIERQLRVELGGEANVRILSDSVSESPRSQAEAVALGDSLDAAVVIWGEVFSLRGEVEIQPHLKHLKRSMVFWDPHGSLLSNLSAPLLKADLSQPGQLELRKNKAEEIGNIGLVAAAYYHGGDEPDKALAILKRIRPRSVMSLLAQAEIEFERDRRVEAESLCYEASSLDPLDPWPYYKLGYMYTLLSRYDEARPMLVKALELEPEEDEFRWQLALVNAAQGNEMAPSMYREVVDRDPENSAVHLRLGWLYTWLDRFDDAISEHKLAIRLDPENVDAHRGLGYAYEVGDSLSRAPHSYERARQLAPSAEYRATMHWLLGRAYWRLGDNERALAEFRSAIAIRPNDSKYYMLTTDAYAGLGRSDEGLRFIEEAAGSHPDDSLFQGLLAETYLWFRRYDEALASYKTSLSFNPGNGDAQFGLGQTYALLDSLDLALESFRTAGRLGFLYYWDYQYPWWIARTHPVSYTHLRAHET